MSISLKSENHIKNSGEESSSKNPEEVFLKFNPKSCGMVIEETTVVLKEI